MAIAAQCVGREGNNTTTITIRSRTRISNRITANKGKLGIAHQRVLSGAIPADKNIATAKQPLRINYGITEQANVITQ